MSTPQFLIMILLFFSAVSTYLRLIKTEEISIAVCVPIIRFTVWILILRYGGFWNQEDKMLKPKAVVMEYFDFEKALDYVADKYNYDVGVLYWEVDGEVDLVEGGLFTYNHIFSPASSMFHKEFGEEAIYKWQ